MDAMGHGPLPAHMDHWTRGDLIAGAGLGASTLFGTWKGIGALIKWLAGRSESHDARLRSWEESLQRREKEYREEIEDRLKKVIDRTAVQDKQLVRLFRQVKVTRHSLVEVTVELKALAPESEAVARAETMLREAFPPEWNLPEDIVDLAHMLDGDQH